jgi:16S rRNA A1518/A1519 N6-dimethyltransferase RsmA/KsgA/DIM1 with predicted DNA glycosylase/AP lyase activity
MYIIHTGLGSITSRLLELYPKMTAVELDGLAVKELNRLLPALDVRYTH